MIRSVFKGSGSALPEKLVTNDELAQRVDTSDEWIRERTGITARHIAAEGETTGTLAAAAARAALADAGIAPDEIDLIVLATATPDSTFPATATQVQDALDSPLAEATYNGRYILMPAGALTPDRAIGEAAVSRRGNRIFFVAILTRPPIEIRGSAEMEEVQNEGEEVAMGPVVRHSAGFINADGVEIRGFGLARALATGGHRVFVIEDTESGEAGQQTQIFAYRIR